MSYYAYDLTSFNIFISVLIYIVDFDFVSRTIQLKKESLWSEDLVTIFIKILFLLIVILLSTLHTHSSKLVNYDALTHQDGQIVVTI